VLRWLSVTDTFTPATLDSAGVLRVWCASFGGAWGPALDRDSCEDQALWPLGIAEGELRYIPCEPGCTPEVRRHSAGCPCCILSACRRKSHTALAEYTSSHNTVQAARSLPTCTPRMQPSDMPAVKAVELPGPSLPADDGTDDHESRLIMLRTRLANLRHIAAHVSLPPDGHDANVQAIAAAELQIDKQLLRLADAAIKQDRLDRALQLISGCGPGQQVQTVPHWQRVEFVSCTMWSGRPLSRKQQSTRSDGAMVSS
jgi:hypothetical protein